MPLYEYECREHGIFEVLRKLSDKDIQTYNCPVCSEESEKVSMPSSFGFSMGSNIRVPKSVDLTVGKAAEKAWRHHYDRKEKRAKTQSDKSS